MACATPGPVPTTELLAGLHPLGLDDICLKAGSAATAEMDA